VLLAVSAAAVMLSLEACAHDVETATLHLADQKADFVVRRQAAHLFLAEYKRDVVLDVSGQSSASLPMPLDSGGTVRISPLDDLRVEDWEEMIDINIKGVLYGIAAALPVFRKQGFGHFVNIASTAGHKTLPNQSVYSGTKFAVRAISEGLRQEAGDKLRVTIISPGFVRTNFAERVTNPEVKAQLVESRDKFAMPPDAVARAIAFAIEQPADVDVGEIIVRPTAQG
jgi:NAD(P)-dependent dehydrogenase (short-subunit alcohol dehydrogenase family)